MREGLLQEHVIVVTGAAGGIGTAVSEMCLAQGAQLVRIDRVGSFGAAAEPDSRELRIECELGEAADARARIDEVVRRFGRIDGIVTCAGGGSGAIDENSADELIAETVLPVFESNVLTAINAITAAREGLLASDRGSIVTIGSEDGRRPVPGGTYSHYSLAKSALHMYTRSLASALGPRNVRANVVAPGTVLTPRLAALWEGRSIETATASKCLRRFAEPEEIAGVVVFLLSRLSSYVTGQVIAVDGGDA